MAASHEMVFVCDRAFYRLEKGNDVLFSSSSIFCSHTSLIYNETLEGAIWVLFCTVAAVRITKEEEDRKKTSDC